MKKRGADMMSIVRLIVVIVFIIFVLWLFSRMTCRLIPNVPCLG
ncbi:MAG: hypothetical protein V1702_05820 [Candidatus Woesearchaeota archaeon]